MLLSSLDSAVIKQHLKNTTTVQVNILSETSLHNLQKCHKERTGKTVCRMGTLSSDKPACHPYCSSNPTKKHER